jgi:hypothetical protein
LIPLALAGLAFAGVTVPGPARSAFHSVGITLPNQPARHAEATHTGQGAGSAGSGTARPDTSTTSKGNSAAAHQHALRQRAKAHGRAVGHEKGKAIGLNGSTSPGHAKAKVQAPPPHSNAGGNSGPHTTPEHTAPVTPGDAGSGHANGHSKK